MSAVVQAFPSFQGVQGRSFALAFIIVVHAAFFIALSTGMRPPILERLPPDITVIPVDDQPAPQPPPPRPVDEVLPTPYVPVDPDVPQVPYDNTGWEIGRPVERHAVVTPTPASAEPVIVPPQIDPQRGLREPVYPPQEIRLNHTGTVLLSIEVLASSKVGEVRIVHSSGYPRLDEAALKAAREWRLRPGTRDGVPVAMWKQIPITFQLRE
jgi:protein TonB